MQTSTQNTITVEPHKATEQGALDGFRARCTCGAVLSTSLGEREARRLAAEHADWHARANR